LPSSRPHLEVVVFTLVVEHRFWWRHHSTTMASPKKCYTFLASLLLLLLVMWTDAACEFPWFVQTNRSSSAGGSRRHQQMATSDEQASASHHPPRDWVTRVRDQFAEIDHRVVISGNLIRTISASSSSSSSSSGGSRRGGGTRASSSSGVIHSRVCVQVVSGDRYLVAHEEPGQRGERYTCIQFVRRSPEVLQIREAPIGDRLDRSMCRDPRATSQSMADR
jgi:hypothetical protein